MPHTFDLSGSGVDMRTSGAMCLTALLASVHSSCGVPRVRQPISFAEETHRADLLNKVSTSVFSALEAEQDGSKESISDVAKSAFRSAFVAVLRSLKGAVADTCNDLAALAQKKIKNMEAENGSADSADDYDLALSFAQSATEKKRHRRVRPHRFLENDIKFFGTVQSLAKRALLGIASSMKNIMKESLLPLLPQIRQQAVEVFRKACEEAENSVLEAY